MQERDRLYPGHRASEEEGGAGVVMMFAAYIDLLVDRMLLGQNMQVCLTPLPAHEQLAITLLVPRLRRWQWSRGWN